jgi:two-component system phosphate regulon sensor histidine kinase PhoR
MTIRLSRVEKKEYIYVASRVEPKGAIPAGIVRLAVPFSNMKDLLGQQRNSLFVGSVFIFLAMAFLSYALIRELSSPIRDMVQAIEAVGQKDFKQRIRFNPEHEFYPLAQAINQMAERVDKLILSISEQRQQLEVVFNRMQEGVMVLDPRGRIQSINRALSTLVSRTPRPIGRRPLEAFMNLELQEACDRVLAPTTDFDAAPCRLQIVLGGGERIYNVSIVRLQDIQKGMGALVVFHDITELRRLETVRQDFVANVSHELRSPITAIKGYTETLLSEAGHDADTAASFMRGILKNTNHMAKIVDDLLALAKLQALEEPIKPVSVNAAEALQAAWKACAPMAEAKAVSLQNDLPEGGIWISADFGQLVQVFRNLIENGVRYSPEGKALTVSCQVQGDRVTFGVRDEGPGIQKSHQQRIFERFYRVERQRNTDLGSTGLGLAICRHIIQNHGGRIWVQSPNSGETRGSTFYFSLSLSESAQAEAPGSQCG